MIKDNDNKLYRVNNKLGTFYVVARSFDAAAEALVKRLDDADYGCSSEREPQSVELVATEHFFAERQSFSGDCNSLITPGI